MHARSPSQSLLCSALSGYSFISNDANVPAVVLADLSGKFLFDNTVPGVTTYNLPIDDSLAKSAVKSAAQT